MGKFENKNIRYSNHDTQYGESSFALGVFAVYGGPFWKSK